MRYFRTARFQRAFRGLEVAQQTRVEEALRELDRAFQTGQLTSGLGLKSLGRGGWEVRAGLSDRILFRRVRNLVEFLIVGNHDDIRVS